MNKSIHCCTVNRKNDSSEQKQKNHHTQIETSEAKNKSKNDMTKLGGGCFLMGTDDKEGFKEDGEGPAREVKVDAFYIDQTALPISNLQHL